MCCCAQPNVNGTPGYQWNPKDAPSIRPVNPPALREGDTLVFDEPGRCGGLDSHCHHYRVVIDAHGRHALLCGNGSGDHAIRISNCRAVIDALAKLDSNGRYWLLNAVYHAEQDAVIQTNSKVNARWTQAAIDKRIKVSRRRNAVRVSITPAPAEPTPAIA